MGLATTLTVLAVLAASPPEERGESCGLQVTVGALSHAVGSGASADVRVVTRGSYPRVAATAGVIDDLRPAGSNAFVGRYLATGAPRQAAVIAALADGDCGFAEVRLDGDTAPVGGHLGLLVDRPHLASDREESVAVYVFAAPAPSQPDELPVLSPGAGEVSALRRIGAGRWRATWRLPPGGEGAVRLAARLGRGPEQSVRVLRTARPPELTVELDRGLVVAGDETPVAVVVRATGASPGPAPAPDGLSLESDGGWLGPPLPVAPGTWRASYYAPETLHGRREARISATLGKASARSAVDLRSGPAVVLRLEFLSGTDERGRPAERAVSVAATDTFGNAADGGGLQAEAARGTLGPEVPAGPGQWRLAYQPPPFAQDGDTDLIDVRLGPVRQSLPVRLSVWRPFLTVSPLLGVAGRTRGSGLYAGAELSTWTRLAGQEVGLALHGTGFRFEDTRQLDSPQGPLLHRGGERYVAFTLSAAWRASLGRRWWVSASAGGGTAWVRSDTTLGSQPTVTEDAWAPAWTAAFSLGLAAWRGGPFLEVRVARVGDPGLGNLQGTLTPLSAAVGYRYDAF